ncbi:LuxR C-terminal-related transcriptional regulator [Halioxenophilus aromaticivorans]|uniref:HTH luxR-type domain-containing protein n=1 Tax=Halioxenophilus aromaticivorans TaxID=1306992 RepID=A0AAV3U8V1_9ALTE
MDSTVPPRSAHGPTKAVNTASNRQVLILASKAGFGTQMLMNLLTKDLNCQCQHLAKGSDVASKPDLVLINCHDLSEQAIADWLQINLRSCQKVALFNVPKSQHYERLVEWPRLNGLFYDDTQESMLLQGLEKVLEGDLWLPRTILAKHLESSRNTHPKRVDISLTQRETDILKLMKNGASNASIGNTLGMSENTVKSHLYKVYRKIGASNRVDAGNWARINIE